MEVGYSITSRQSLDQSPTAAGWSIVERARSAQAAGLDYVQAGDHHVVTDSQYFQNVPTLGRLAAEFDHVAGMFLLPLHDPILLAEQIGTLAALVDGFDLWCAVGYVDAEFDAFGVPKHERGERFEEILEIIHRLWREDDVSHDGTHYALDSVTINPTADPRIVIGGSAKAAVERAGRLGDAWVAAPYITKDSLERKREWYRMAGGECVVLRRDALIFEDGDAADERASELLECGYRGWSPEDRPQLLVGGPDDVAADLADYAALGVDEVVVRPIIGDHADETFRVLDQARNRL